MASNIPISTGSGQASVATEQIGNNQFQLIKVTDGTVGSTNKWVINSDGSAQVSVIGGIPLTGSIVAVPTGNQSVSGTVGASIIGAVPIQLSNSSVITIAQGSIAAVIIGGSIAQSVSGTVGASIIGTVPVVQSGINVTSVVSTVPSSVLVGASIFGQLPGGTAVLGSVAALQGTNPWIVTSSIAGGLFPIAGSVAAVITNTVTVVSSLAGGLFPIAGSVAAFVTGGSIAGYLQSSGASIITLNQGSSILAVPVGSVITVFQAPSIVGTYAEDAPSASGDKGFLVMGARNDTLSSVTSTDGDYSSHVVGPAGELIAENAPLTKWVSGNASMLGGIPLTTSVVVIAAQGASVFTYITGVQVVNFGPNSVLVGLYGGTSSLLAYTIAPGGGGSNIYYQNGIKTNANSAFAASVSGTASVYVSAQGFISKT